LVKGVKWITMRACWDPRAESPLNEPFSSRSGPRAYHSRRKVEALRVLVVEDEAALARQLESALTDAGYAVDRASDGERADFLGRTETYDAVVLDLGLPRTDGMTVLRKWRAAGGVVPVLVLTARASWHEKVEGIDGGADDYVAKPFEPRELSLRIGNVLKHARPAPTPPRETIRFGEFVFHLARGELRRGDDIVHLTDRERDMLRVLAGSAGETVPRLALAGDGGSINERAVDVQVNRLRRKIERNPANPLFVQTVRGIGYRLMVPT